MVNISQVLIKTVLRTISLFKINIFHASAQSVDTVGVA